MKKVFLIQSLKVILTIGIIDIYGGLVFHGTQDTLSTIAKIISAKQKGAYLRFGDGDVNLALGLNDALQSRNQSLMYEMREAFSLQDPHILKTLPLYCKEFNGYEEGMFPGNHGAPYEWCLDIVNKVKPLWNGPLKDVYSHAALHFAASQYPDFCIQFLKFLKKSNCYMLIGNEKIPASMPELLFGPDCLFVPTPSQQSYNAIDRIEKECLEKIGDNKEYKIIVTAMGCSGRALQKRLWKKLDNVFLFDFGSVLDALCGWNTRAWIELTEFDEKTFIKNFKIALES